MQTSLVDNIPSLNRSGISGIGQDAGTEGTCMLHEQKTLCMALSLTTPTPMALFLGSSLSSWVTDGSARGVATC